MTTSPHFKDLQMRFARHLRDPNHYAKPEGLEDRRVKIYRDLLFNNVRNFISGGFPVLREFYSKDGWTSLVRDFFREHRAHTPYFSEIGAEFVHYLSHTHNRSPRDPPFLAELAHYEYAETAIYTAEDCIYPKELDPNLSLREHLPVVNDLVLVFSYRWPVHTIKANFTPWRQPEQRTHILLFRNRLDRVQFTVTTQAIARLIEIVRESYDLKPRQSGRRIVERMARKYPEYGGFEEQALTELDNLLRRGVILGAVRLEE